MRMIIGVITSLSCGFLLYLLFCQQLDLHLHFTLKQIKLMKEYIKGNRGDKLAENNASYPIASDLIANINMSKITEGNLSVFVYFNMFTVHKSVPQPELQCWGSSRWASWRQQDPWGWKRRNFGWIKRTFGGPVESPLAAQTTRFCLWMFFIYFFWGKSLFLHCKLIIFLHKLLFVSQQHKTTTQTLHFPDKCLMFLYAKRLITGRPVNYSYR